MPDAALPINALARLNLRSALDILIIAILIYYLLKLLRGTRAVQMLVAIGLLMVFYRSARWARLEMVEWLLTTMLPYIAITMIILFQPEIRRALSRIGRNLSLMKFASHNTKAEHDDIVMAAEYFSQNRIGALLVVARQAGLQTYIESGIPFPWTRNSPTICCFQFSGPGPLCMTAPQSLKDHAWPRRDAFCHFRSIP